MPQSKFTKGEWLLTKDMAEDQFVVETEDFGHIADIHAPLPYDSEYTRDFTGEWVANARLIVNAPKMYQLLRRVQQLVVAENLMNKYVTGQDSPVTEELTQEISIVLRQIDEGGSARPKETRIY